MYNFKFYIYCFNIISILILQVLNDQTYICREQDSVYNFLYSKGYIFKLCYKLLSNSLIKFDIHFSDIPVSIIYLLV